MCVFLHARYWVINYSRTNKQNWVEWLSSRGLPCIFLGIFSGKGRHPNALQLLSLWWICSQNKLSFSDGWKENFLWTCAHFAEVSGPWRLSADHLFRNSLFAQSWKEQLFLFFILVTSLPSWKPIPASYCRLNSALYWIQDKIILQ